ncbi:hypothetical protein [Aestuariispira insulae]|uniref:Uncharacterized protein n=1 Tax=Aestuariispira insulae TaxID=1461337 RepID=A0A3D9H3U3_9PROT|nr:hypothetical protein [Aestuariispira insulae]RED44142.1 hypothetical protein DFP90_11746 [Aestuariispira insulae]
MGLISKIVVGITTPVIVLGGLSMFQFIQVFGDIDSQREEVLSDWASSNTYEKPVYDAIIKNCFDSEKSSQITPSPFITVLDCVQSTGREHGVIQSDLDQLITNLDGVVKNTEIPAPLVWITGTPV